VCTDQLSRPKAQISEDQKDLIRELMKEKNEKDLEFRKSCLAIENAPDEKVETSKDVNLSRATTTVADNAPTTARDSMLREIPTEQLSAHATSDEGARAFASASISSMARPATRKQPPPPLLKWASSKSTVDSDLGSTSDAALPPSLRVRDEEIRHHAVLVNNLLQEISHVQYLIDNGIRHRLHDGVLKLHLEEWKPFATRYGHEHFHRAFEPHKHVVCSLVRYVSSIDR
jgi:hypothetical protein